LANVDGGGSTVRTIHNVLYILNNYNNLISLGRWDASGGQYQGGNGVLLLITKDGHTIAKGNKINNHLYCMKMHVQKPNTQSNIIRVSTARVNSALEVAQSWETWHKCFGHVRYSSLQCMMQGHLVDRFNVDE
jgi:hypothetical protein